MLTIRQEQMNVLGEEIVCLFELRMERYLRSAYAAQLQARSDEQVLSLIRQGIAESERYGVVTANDVSRYIGYMVTYGGDFDTQPWAAKILHEPRLNGAQKMDRIDNYDLFNGRGGTG